MSELRPDEPGLQGVRRILKDWIAEASDTLHKKRVTDAHIHDARKSLKKSRAALRLLRDAMGEVAYRRENAALRDAARPLGGARDSKASMATLDNLAERFAPAMRSLQLDDFRRVLRKEQAAARHVISAALIARQRRALREVSQRSIRWRMTGGDWPVLGAGLERVYRNAKKTMRAAERSCDSEQLHEWRKQVKYLWHQLQMLQPAWPGMLGELADQAHKLSDHLGDDHDLAVLHEKIAAYPDSFANNDRDALLAVLESRRKQLQDRAFKLGARIFAEKPRRFTNRIGAYWQRR